MKALQKAKLLLCQSDYTIPDLAAELCLSSDASVRRFIYRECNNGNVAIVGYVEKEGKKTLPLYSWVNDFDIGYLTICAANLLSSRDDNDGRLVASRIYAAFA